MASIALLTIGIFAALLAWLVHFPPRRPGELAALTFGWSWFGGEAPWHVAVLEVALMTVCIGFGALSEQAVFGATGLGLGALGLLASAVSAREANAVRLMLSAAVGREVGLAASPWRLVLGFWFGDREVIATPAIRRDDRLRADLYRPHLPVPGAPLLVYVHGGGWVLGFRRFQGRLLIRRLVRAGWVCVSVEYRRSPWATWPDHIVDVKRALAWAKRKAPDWGADPERIAISGNSAGGHLASLAALTPQYPAFQPGFEDADTRVQALVSWYGVYDLLDAAGAWPHSALRRLWEVMIMKQTQRQASEVFAEASPVTHLSAEAPPTLLIHGTHDTLVPIAAAHAFHAAFETVAPGQATLWPIRGAQHAFEVFWSRRGAYAVDAAACWLESQFRAGR
jgi:acetyl esterase/lipase